MITGYYMTKEFVQSNMSNLLEDIRRNLTLHRTEIASIEFIKY